MPPPRPLAARFWEKVATADANTCWEWRGGRDACGYGRLLRNGRPGPYEAAHRIAWALTRGPIPPGLKVLHRCDNPPCVNPNHLWLGTLADNNADRNAKGREAHVTGEKNGNAKLSAEAISELRARGAAGETRDSLAAAFGICRSYVIKVLRREVRA